jgi:protein-S-isoprenylcysteine O-methyltransferase Ste14
MVALIVPLLIAVVDPWRGDFASWAIAIVVIGALAIGRTVVDFFTLGRGTLAPWNPPRRLVTTGLYGISRNPMYIGVVMLAAGLALTFGSGLGIAYSAVLLVGFPIRVIRYEEPWAKLTFPGDWPPYKQNVARWIPLRRRA